MVNFETMSFYLLYINKCSKCAVINSTRNSSCSSIHFLPFSGLRSSKWRRHPVPTPSHFPGALWVFFFIWKSLCLLRGSRTHSFPFKSYTHFRILLLKSLLSFYRWRESFCKEAPVPAHTHSLTHALLPTSCSAPTIYSSSCTHARTHACTHALLATSCRAPAIYSSSWTHARASSHIL